MLIHLLGRPKIKYLRVIDDHMNSGTIDDPSHVSYDGENYQLPNKVRSCSGLMLTMNGEDYIIASYNAICDCYPVVTRICDDIVPLEMVDRSIDLDIILFKKQLITSSSSSTSTTSTSSTTTTSTTQMSPNVFANQFDFLIPMNQLLAYINYIDSKDNVCKIQCRIMSNEYCNLYTIVTPPIVFIHITYDMSICAPNELIGGFIRDLDTHKIIAIISSYEQDCINRFVCIPAFYIVKFMECIGRMNKYISGHLLGDFNIVVNSQQNCELSYKMINICSKRRGKFKKNDIVLALNDVKSDDMGLFYSSVLRISLPLNTYINMHYFVGDMVNITILRNKNIKQINVTVESCEQYSHILIQHPHKWINFHGLVLTEMSEEFINHPRSFLLGGYVVEKYERNLSSKTPDSKIVVVTHINQKSENMEVFKCISLPYKYLRENIYELSVIFKVNGKKIRSLEEFTREVSKSSENIINIGTNPSSNHTLKFTSGLAEIV